MIFEFSIPFLVIAAIATVVTVAEILKNNGLAVEKSEILFFPFLSCEIPFCSCHLCPILDWINNLI